MRSSIVQLPNGILLRRSERSNEWYESGEKRRGINIRRIKEKTDLRATDDHEAEDVSKEVKQHDSQSEEQQVRFHGATHY